MLSPYYQRASVTISVSGGPAIDYWRYLLDVDAILRQYGARPHWGKLHFNHRGRHAGALSALSGFPARSAAASTPPGRFLNDHLRGLFG